jgi:hypothetical protein
MRKTGAQALFSQNPQNTRGTGVQIHCQPAPLSAGQCLAAAWQFMITLIEPKIYAS